MAEPVAAAADEPASEDTSVVSLAAYNVKADRIEDFGLRVRMAPTSSYPKTPVGFFTSRYVPIVWAVVPNTAAAKAGLQPGERILKSDGASTSVGLISSVHMRTWQRMQKRKWEEVAAGKANVTWTLEVQSRDMKTKRTVKLVIPTPPPRWGASAWQPPEGRAPSTVKEAGPLAERARAVLDHGVLTSLHERYAKMLGLNFRGMQSDLASGREPTGFEWSIGGPGAGLHRIFVTQFRGRTDVFLEARSNGGSFRIYHTSPTGELLKAWQVSSQRGKPGEAPLEEFRASFAHELDLWTNQVAKVSARWPFELKPGYDADAIFATLDPKSAAPATAPAPRPLAAEFLKLRIATEPERTLFTDAYGKLGAESDRWAYTETSRGIDDKRVLVTRVDPSKPEGERSALLSVEGRAPTPDEVQEWRNDGGDAPKALGEIPPPASLVDLKDLRIATEEAAATVFELPLQGGNAEFPPEKFQALFRVNKTTRAFEEVIVKLRDSFRVAGVVKVVDAGLEMRFQTLDPAHPPQPVLLKMGGGVRVLLVQVSRSFEATRTDFKRVVPFEDANVRAK